ncbi:MAG: nitrogen regulatory IIA protein [Deltaproteobacteria bacterium]|nr:MAG: nitrogen regulatory IIA protein [Deltaproteobacteria bacterium]
MFRRDLAGGRVSSFRLANGLASLEWPRYLAGVVMRLADIIDVERTTTSLPRDDKDAALGALAELFTSLDPAEVLAAFREREALATTGVGSGVAVPHGRLQAVDRMVGALAVSEEGIHFDAIDGQPVHVVVAIVAPERGDLVKVLARVARLLRDDTLRSRLARAIDADQAFRILARADGG